MGTAEKRKSKTLSAPPPCPWSRRSLRRRRWQLQRRDWAWLHEDVLRIVLGKLRQADILGSAGMVFPRWRRLALADPRLWRRIDLLDSSPWLWNQPRHAGWKAMALAAVDASAGRCESFRGYVDANVIVHLAIRATAPLLRDLCALGWPYMADRKLSMEIAMKLPLLERVVLWGGQFQGELILALLDHCPRLELLHVSHYAEPTFRDWWEESIRTRIVGRRNLTISIGVPLLRLG